MTLSTLFKTGIIINPSPKHYKSFILHLLRSKHSQFIPHFISQLISNKIKFPYSILTKTLLKPQNHDKALTFLNTQIPKPPNKLQNHIFNALVQSLCINLQNPLRGFDIVKDFVKKDGFWVSRLTFCVLIRSFCAKGMMDGAIEAVEVMFGEKFRYPFDNFVISSVVCGLVNVGEYEAALAFYDNAAKCVGFEMNVVSCTCVLSAYCRLNRFEDVCDLVSVVEDSGLTLDAVFYGSLVYEYFRVGGVMEALRKHKEMVDKKIDRDTVSYTILIDGFVKEGLVEKAVGFLYKMRKEGISPKLIAYTAIMSGFCKKGKVDEALRVFKLVEELGMEMDEFMYATLIDGFCRICDFDSVFRLLDEMKGKGVHSSVVTYNIIINGLCKSGRANEAYKVSKGINGDVITYSSLLHGYIKEKDLTGVIMTKKRLEEVGVCMDVVMCNMLIRALFLVGSFEDVNVIYKGMPEMGLTPDQVTFCTLVDGYCKLGRIEEALEIFDNFRRARIDSVACYNCIINGLCKNEMIDMAIQVFLELIERGMPSDPGTFRILLQSILKAKGPDGILDFISRIENMGREVFHIICNDALCFLCDGHFNESVNDLYTFMKRNGILLTKTSYNSLVELVLKDQKMCHLKIHITDFVKEFGISDPRVRYIILNHLCMKDIHIAIKFLRTNNVTFPVFVLEKLTKNGRALDAFNLVMGSKENLPFMDVVDYTILVDGLCKEGHIRKGLEMCTLAINNKITLNIVTYNTIINGLFRQGCFVEAFRLFDSLENINVMPSEITYSTLIDALCKECYLLDADKLFEKMVFNNLKPNIRVYNSLINGYSKLGQLPEVLRLVVDLDENGIKPDEFTVSVVINTFCRTGNMEGALEYYLDSRSKGYSPDLLGFFYLIRGLCSKGRMEESRSVLRDMLETENTVDLLKKVDTGSETESVDVFLVSLCDQGNIQEAVMILDEIVCMYFPVGKKVVEGKYRVVESVPLISNKDDVSDDFDAYYGLLASLCSKGELQKANKVAKLLAGFDGG